MKEWYECRDTRCQGAAPTETGYPTGGQETITPAG